MTIPAQQDVHPYDYYYRPGMPMRPAPPRLRRDPAWADRPVFDEFRPETLTDAQRGLLELFIDHYWQGDPLMDAVVERFRVISVARGRRLLEQALDHGIDSLADPPRELVDLFASLDNPPGWHDPVVWERGRRLWIDCSLAGKVGMGIQDAIGTFVGAEVSSATGATKRFVTAPLVRNLETAKWFHDATKPGFIDRYSPEFKETVRVRLMHSQVRLGLRRSWGDEHFAIHGNPISTSTTMGAAVTFGLLPMLTDHNHGRRRSVAEFDAVMRYWAYIAYVFGVTPEIIPTTAQDGIMLADYMISTAGGPTDWTAQMTQAAADGLAGIPGLPGLLARAAVAPVVGMVAYYSGDALARALVSATPYRDVAIQPWKALTGVAVHAGVKSRMVLDRIPGAGLRRVLRARTSDPFWAVNVQIATMLARRGGITGTPYRHHDRTPDVPRGCPMH